MTGEAPNDPGVAFGPFRLFPARHLLLEGETPVRLGSRARDLLIALLEQPGRAVSKEALCARIWPNVFVEDGTLRAQVAALRKALRDGQDGRRYIANIAGRGYAFVGEISSAEERARDPARPEPAALAQAESAQAESAPALSTGRLFGRAEVIETLTQRLAEDRFVTIVGPGGIGKTAVSLAVADRLRASLRNGPHGSLRDGVCFVDLAPLADDRLVPTALASALGVGVVSDDPLPGLVALLRDRDMLIVLDNCEHVIDSAALVAETIARGAGPRLRILATSREALGVQGERVFRLAPLALPEKLPLALPEALPDAALETPLEMVGRLGAAEAMTFPAVQLFVERAAMCLGEYALTDAHVPAVVGICRHLDGIALAIEIAAGQVDAFGVAGLARVLDDRFRLAMQGRRTGLPRHRTMHTTLDWSYQLLPEGERATLRRLAVFAGLFTIPQAAGVLAGEGDADGEGAADAAVAAESIANLVAKSLVVPNFETPVPTYRLLETTRAYALQKLEEAGEHAAGTRRHARQCLAAMEAANREWDALPPAAWLARHRHLIDDVRAALDFAEQADAATAVALAVALAAAAVPLWYQLSLLNECHERAGRVLGLAAAGEVAPRRLLPLQAARAWTAMQIKGFVRETEEAWTTVLELARAAGDGEHQLRGLWGLWATRVNSGALRTSLALAREFLELVPEAGAIDRSVGHRMMGHSLHLLGDQPAAREHLERMLLGYRPPATGAQTMRYVFDQRSLARSFLARIAWLQGRPDEARRIAWALAEEERARGDALSLVQVLVQAACPVGLLVGDLDAVDGFVAELLGTADHHQWHFWRAYGACFRGVLTVQRGDVAAGLPLLEAAMTDMRSIEFGVFYLYFLARHAEALCLAGRHDAALDVIGEAIARSDRNDERWCIAEVLRLKGTLLHRRGELEAAERSFAAAFDWADHQGALAWSLRIAISAAHLARDTGGLDAARARLAAVLGRFTEGHDTADHRAARALLAAPSL